jgi:membrane peptidoglycan carboxypeptidase
MLPSKVPTRKYQILLIILAVGIFAVITYYAGTVWRARIQTPEIVRSALASDQIKLRASDLSGWQKCTLLAIQDPDFYKHPGITRPFWESFRHTTITQAIVKRLYFNHFKPGVRKIRQTLIARYALDPLVSKEDQLTLYINIVWFATSPVGKPIYGFADAAREFFEKPVAQLSEDEYIAMAAMLDAPSRLNPRTHPRESAELVAKLKRLVLKNCGSQNKAALPRP